jgi:predicted transcriptional regulator
MSSLRLEIVVHHDGRLNVLCCLLDNGPLSIRQLAARTGDSAQAIHYWVRLLEAFALIRHEGESGGGEALYVASLDGQPEWVLEAVRNHRPRTI